MCFRIHKVVATV